MLRLAGVSLSVLFCALILKDRNRTYAVLLSVAGSVMLLAIIVGELSGLASKLRELTSFSDSSEAYLKLMLKALGITILTQIVSDICRDNGENALASMTEAASKIAVISMLFPLFDTIIDIVGGLLK